MKKILTILLVLIVMLAALLVIRHFTRAEFSGLKITYMGREFFLQKEQLVELSFKELWAGNEKFQAVAIEKIFEIFSIKPAKVRSITFISNDGGALVLKKSELNKAFLALEEQMNKLQFRLIIPNDEFRQRWLKRVVELQVR